MNGKFGFESLQICHRHKPVTVWSPDKSICNLFQFSLWNHSPLWVYWSLIIQGSALPACVNAAVCIYYLWEPAEEAAT